MLGPVGDRADPPAVDDPPAPAWLDSVRAALMDLIAGDADAEICALVVALPDGLRLVSLRSVQRSPFAFAIPAGEWARVEGWVAAQGGRTLAIVHSHPGGAALHPSDVDRAAMAGTPGLPWVIVGRDGTVVTVPPSASHR
jgi:proteasome lid subunit RPN8/RPN11